MSKMLCPILSRDIEKISFTLTVEEEVKLILLAKQGDTNARNKLLNSQLKQITSIARSYANPMNSVTDLVSDAVLGFDHAISRFDLSAGVRFFTYYVQWVRDFVNRSVHSNHTIRPPMNVAKTNSKTDEELEQLKGTKRKKGQFVHTGVSMDAPIGSDDGAKTTYGETFSNDECIETDVVNSLTIRKILKSVDRTSREWKFLKYHYVDDMKLHEIGELFGVSKQCVSVNIQKVLSRLQARANKVVY
jgi:RNA polymerase sigma factor (sigma-70 family)